jgi:hypothetical protein
MSADEPRRPPWTIGADLAGAEAAQQGDLLPIFATTHATRGTPVGAAMLCSIVGTVFTLGCAGLFSLTGGAIDDVFWNLFAFSSVIFLLPYIVMMLAFGKLRRLDPDRPRAVPRPGWRRRHLARDHHVGGPKDWPSAVRRTEAWRAALQAAGRDVPDVLGGDWSLASGHEAGRALAQRPGVTTTYRRPPSCRVP